MTIHKVRWVLGINIVLIPCCNFSSSLLTSHASLLPGVERKKLVTSHPKSGVHHNRFKMAVFLKGGVIVIKIKVRLDRCFIPHIFWVTSSPVISSPEWWKGRRMVSMIMVMYRYVGRHMYVCIHIYNRLDVFIYLFLFFSFTLSPLLQVPLSTPSLPDSFLLHSPLKEEGQPSQGLPQNVA